MKLARGTWVFALDGTKMLLLKNAGDTRKPQLQALVQQEADNPRTSEQGSDRPGRVFSSASPRRSAVGDADWHEEAKKDFVRTALRVLEKHHADRGGDIIVLAAPTVLGDLRKHYPDQLRAAIAAEIDKDVVNHAPEQIVAIIDSHEN